MNGIGFAITSILFIAILSASNFCNCMDLERGAKWWEEPSPEFVDFVYDFGGGLIDEADKEMFV